MIIITIVFVMKNIKKLNNIYILIMKYSYFENKSDETMAYNKLLKSIEELI